MPYNWTAERERHMLLLAISAANLRPSADTWNAVAALLGEGLSASAVSQKYYKLRNESAKLFEGHNPGFVGTRPNTSTPSTPRKRKSSHDEDGNEVKPRAVKRAKAMSAMATIPKYDNVDGEPFSDDSQSIATGSSPLVASYSPINVTARSSNGNLSTSGYPYPPSYPPLHQEMSYRYGQMYGGVKHEETGVSSGSGSGSSNNGSIQV